MEILINVKVWGRAQVFEQVVKSWRNQHTRHKIGIAAGVSEDDPQYEQVKRICHFWCDYTFTVPNSPLSNKANALCDASRTARWDHLMIMGSDDLVSPGFFDAYEDDVESWGWEDIYFYHPDSGLYYWPGYGKRRRESIGAGRILRRDIVERMRYQLCEPGKPLNLDHWTTQRMKDLGIPKIPYDRLPDGVYMVDIKTPESITPLSAFPDGVLRQVETPDCIRGPLDACFE